MKVNESDMDALIGKDLLGATTPEEKEMLEDWLNQADENRLHYQQLKLLFTASDHLKTHQVFDTDAAWLTVKNKIKTKNKKTRLTQVYARIAASVIVIISAAAVLYQTQLRPQDVVHLASANETVNYVLPDGSAVFLNKNTVIKHEYHPLKQTRNVTLSGEAYFTMSENKHEDFVIEIDGVWIKDIGTAFNVKAYPDKDTVEVYVETGEVIFYTLRDSVNIRAGETGYYNKQQDIFSKQLNLNRNVVSYKTQVLVFEDARLNEVIETINEVYDASLKLEHKELGQCRITVTFKHETLDVIVAVIAETLLLTPEKTDHEITLKGKGCSL